MKTSFLLLAAGRSSRMKTDKALLEFEGKAWILHQAEQIQKTGFIDEILIADRAQKNLEYERALVPLVSPDLTIRTLENHLKDSEPYESILLGLQNLQFQNGCFISPVDVPLDVKVLEILWLQRKTDALAMKASFENHGGHPVWLSAPAIAQFLEKPRRLDEFLADLPVQFVEIQSPLALMNLNTPEEWQSFTNQQKSNPLL